jgi:1-acyl-sn-glycerol-3-phosphate acyltransferase
MNRYIKLRRGDRQSVVTMMRACEKTLAEGNSIMMFPEGTRSPSGRMRRFKPGAFELALRGRCALLPIVIRGTARALPKRGFVLQGRHDITLTVLEPIPYEQFRHHSAEKLTLEMHDLFARELGPDLVAPSPDR